MQLYSPNIKSVHRALHRLFRVFALFQRTQYSRYASRLCTACFTLEGIASSAAPAPIPDTTAMPNAVQSRAAAYYNKVYKGAPLSWIHARQCIIVQTMPAAAVCSYHVQIAGKCWRTVSSTDPAHLLRGSASPPVQGQPGGVSMLLTPGGLRSGTGSTVRTHKASLAPSTRRGSPTAGVRQTARNHWRLAAASLFGLSPDSQ